jgi:hypothetical protein
VEGFAMISAETQTMSGAGIDDEVGAPDATWSAPESGQPRGGREELLEAAAHARGPLDTPPSEANGEDF